MATELDEMEAATQPLIERTLAAMMREMLADYEADRIVKLPDDARERVLSMLRQTYDTAMRMAGQPMIEDMKDCFPHLQTKQDADDLYDQMIEDYIERYGAAKVVQINQTTRLQIMDTIRRGQREGLSVSQISGLLREAIPQFSRRRAAVIARTETHGSSQYGSMRTAQTSTEPMVKKWNSTEDARTRTIFDDDRYDHLDADGQTVAMEQPFMIRTIMGTKEPIMFPGDPAASAGNVINCRCAVSFRRADRRRLPTGGRRRLPSIDAPTAAPVSAAPRRPRFAYLNFSAPKSTKGIDNFIKDNGIAEYVDFDGFSVKSTAPALQSMQEVTERFSLRPVLAMGPVQKFSNLFRARTPRKAEAAVFYSATTRQSDNIAAFHIPKKFGSDAEQRKLAGTAKRNQTAYNNFQEKAVADAPDDIKQIYKRMRDQDDPWSFTVFNDADPDLRRRSTIYHEYGHIVHLANKGNPEMGREINDFLKNHQPRKNKWDLLISRYADDHDDEYIAETFSLYMLDESQHYRIHPELLKIYRRYDRAVDL